MFSRYTYNTCVASTPASTHIDTCNTHYNTTQEPVSGVSLSADPGELVFV